MSKINMPSGYKDLVRIGTSSWTYDSWKDLIYQPSKKYKTHEYLADYSKYYNTVEVDQWFWSLFPIGIKLPKTEVVKSYADSIPDDFIFTLKAPNSITLTNFYAKQPANQIKFSNKPNEHFLETGILKEFLKRLEPMAGKLGPVMFQFEYLNKNKMSSLDEFIDRLKKFFADIPRGFEYAIELRNPNFLRSPFFEFLNDCRLGLVLVDGHFMPPIEQVADNFQTQAGFTIIRLQGNAPYEKSEKDVWNGKLEAKDNKLESAVKIAAKNAKRGVRTYIYVKNQYEGCGPITIERIVEKLRTANVKTAVTSGVH